jgi:hypothetical protein
LPNPNLAKANGGFDLECLLGCLLEHDFGTLTKIFVVDASKMNLSRRVRRTELVCFAQFSTFRPAKNAIREGELLLVENNGQPIMIKPSNVEILSRYAWFLDEHRLPQTPKNNQNNLHFGEALLGGVPEELLALKILQKHISTRKASTQLPKKLLKNYVIILTIKNQNILERWQLMQNLKIVLFKKKTKIGMEVQMKMPMKMPMKIPMKMPMKI